MRAPKLPTLGFRVPAMQNRVLVPKRTPVSLYTSPEWRSLVTQLIALRGRRCEMRHCGRTHDREGKPIRIFGDHIIELRDGGAALDPSNVRLICGSCHTIKTNQAKVARMAQYL